MGAREILGILSRAKLRLGVEVFQWSDSRVFEVIDDFCGLIIWFAVWSVIIIRWSLNLIFISNWFGCCGNLSEFCWVLAGLPVVAHSPHVSI